MSKKKKKIITDGETKAQIDFTQSLCTSKLLITDESALIYNARVN